MIPLLEAMEAKLGDKTWAPFHDELYAERASYLARIGSFDEVDRVLKDLRTRPDFGSNVRVAALVMIVDGLVLFFRDQSDRAKDRFARAQLIAKAAQQLDLYRLASAWIAHIDFSTASYETMGLSLRECLLPGSQTDHAASLRGYIVAANAATYVGSFEEARRWYRLAHTVAVRLGDQVSIEAIIYNRTVFRLGRARTMSCLGIADPSAAFAAMEVSSAASYYQAVGYRSLQHLIVALQARVSMFLGDFAQAIPQFEAVLETGRKVSFEPDQAMIAIELAACKAKAFMHDVSSISLREISVETIARLDPDDRLLCLDALRSIVSAGVEVDLRGIDLTHDFDAAAAAYQDEVDRIKEVLRSVSSLQKN